MFGFILISKVPNKKPDRMSLSELITPEALSFLVVYIFFVRIRDIALSGAQVRVYCSNDPAFEQFLEEYLAKLEGEYDVFDEVNKKRSGALMEHVLGFLVRTGCIQPAEEPEADAESDTAQQNLSSRQLKLLKANKRKYVEEPDDEEMAEDDVLEPQVSFFVVLNACILNLFILN